jgi:hypothetical protein
VSGPDVDPRYVTLLTRLRSVRGELDRLDDGVQLFDRPERVELARYTTRVRGELDALEDVVDHRAASRS